jgi:hypothetical protein
MPVIGFLNANTAAESLCWGLGFNRESRWVASFVQQLREVGWIEDPNMTIEYRWAEGHALCPIAPLLLPARPVSTVAPA